MTGPPPGMYTSALLVYTIDTSGGKQRNGSGGARQAQLAAVLVELEIAECVDHALATAVTPFYHSLLERWD